jgi:hypothetical protein
MVLLYHSWTCGNSWHVTVNPEAKYTMYGTDMHSVGMQYMAVHGMAVLWHTRSMGVHCVGKRKMGMIAMDISKQYFSLAVKININTYANF